MLVLSNAACTAAQKKFEDAMRRRLDVLIRMEDPADNSPLRDLRQIAENTYPIYDPLVKEVCHQVERTLSIPKNLKEIIDSFIQFMVHFWYGALKEEEFLSGQPVPLLRRQRVEQILPPLLKDKQIDRKLLTETLGGLYRFSQALIDGVATTHPGGPYGRDLAEKACFRPVLVLSHLMNDATQPG